MKKYSGIVLFFSLILSQASIGATSGKFLHKKHKKVAVKESVAARTAEFDRVISPSDPDWKLSSINMSGDEPVAVVIVGGGFYYVKQGTVVMGKTVKKITYDYVKVDDFELSMAQERNFIRSKPE